MKNDSESPFVSIVMRSKNEQPYTEKTLKALFSQSYQNFRLYNIDSGSDDGTLEVIKKWNTEPNQIFTIQPGEYVPGDVLNMIINNTREEIIVFLNADAVPMCDQWLSRLVIPIVHNEAEATLSRQLPRPDAHYIVSNDYFRAYHEINMKKDPYFFSNVSCAFKRILWEKHKFYTEGYAEDLEWAKKCKDDGARFCFIFESVVEHSHNYTISQLYQKRFRHGKAFVKIFGSSPHPLKHLLSFLKESCRDMLSALSSGKWRTIPYNVIYRFTIYRALYDGLREGRRGR